MAARNLAGLAVELTPLLFVTGAAAGLVAALTAGSPWPLLGSLFSLYLAPPLLHRLHNRFAPLVPGAYSVRGARYLPWWGSHQLQRLYLSFPSLEAGLRLIPGAYSAWLRLWGAEVGRGVYWTPRVQLLDRSLLKIGDRAVFGHEAGLTSHVISWREGELKLLIEPITIGDGALIGAQAAIGPGAVVRPGATVLARASVQIREVVE